MNPVAILLVSVFCFTEAFYNIFIKKEANSNPEFEHQIPIFSAFSMGLASLMLFVASIFSGGMEVTPGWWKPVIITGILLGAIVYSEMKALSLEDASLVGPIAATTPASVVVVSAFVLGEYPTWAGWLGIQVIVIGTYILNIQGFLEKRRVGGNASSWKDWLAPLLMFKKSRGLRYAYLCVLLGTFAMNSEALAVRKANVAFASGCIFGLGAIINLLFAYRNGSPLLNIKKLCNRNLLIVATCLFIGALSVNWAFRYEIVAYVGTLKRFQIPLTIILAYFLLGERKNFRSRILGGSIMTAGLLLIAFG